VVTVPTENLKKRSTTITFVAILVVVAASVGVLQIGSPLATASNAPQGVVPLGSTNEGGSGSSRGPATGIVDIIAGPCAGMVKEATYEGLTSRIKLTKDSKVVAQWEIHGRQRIAWVEPVGVYSIHSNQSTTLKRVRVVVSPSRVAEVRLMPACK